MSQFILCFSFNGELSISFLSMFIIIILAFGAKLLGLTVTMLEFRWLPIAIIKSELCNAKFAPLWPAIPGDPRFNISSESNASKFDHVTTYGILVFLINGNNFVCNFAYFSNIYFGFVFKISHYFPTSAHRRQN